MPNPFEKYAQPIIDAIRSDQVVEHRGASTPPWPQSEIDDDIDDDTDDAIHMEYGRIVPFDEHEPFWWTTNAPRVDREKIDYLIEEYGIEILAYYKCIHKKDCAPHPGRWGIFVYDWAMRYLDDRLGLAGNRDHMDRAWKYLIEHELFHHWVCCWTLAHESVTRSQLCRPYSRNVYHRLFPHRDCVEESLANKYALKTRGLGPIKDKLKRFCRNQPPAYRYFEDAPELLQSTLAAQILRRHDWIEQYFGAHRQIVRLDSQWPGLTPNRIGPFEPKYCPIYEIRGTPPTSLMPTLSIPDRPELVRFVFDYLSAHPIDRTDHNYVKIDNGEKVRIPNVHGATGIKLGELTNIRLKAGMTGKEYKRERDRTKQWRRRVPRTTPKTSLVP